MCLAVPGRLVETYVDAHGVKMGRVDFNGVKRAVCVEHVPAANIGDYLLVHVGFALTRLDEAEATRLLEMLTELGELSAFEDEDDEEEEVGEVVQ